MIYAKHEAAKRSENGKLTLTTSCARLLVQLKITREYCSISWRTLLLTRYNDLYIQNIIDPVVGMWGGRHILPFRQQLSIALESSQSSSNVSYTIRDRLYTSSLFLVTYTDYCGMVVTSSSSEFDSACASMILNVLKLELLISAKMISIARTCRT